MHAIRVFGIIVALCCSIAAQGPVQQNPPSTTPPHVSSATPTSDSRNCEVKKSHAVMVRKMWRQIDGTWWLVWSVPDNINEGFEVTGQGTSTTKISEIDGKFPQGQQVVVEIVSADDAGNSTSITTVTFNNKS